MIDQLFDATVAYFKMQAQLVSAVKTAISTTSGPLLLEAGLELATKVKALSLNKSCSFPLILTSFDKELCSLTPGYDEQRHWWGQSGP